MKIIHNICVSILALSAFFSYSYADDLPDSNDNVPDNEKPLYGNTKKPRILNKDSADYAALKKSSATTAALGWQYMKKNDLKTAMKRFNQAWLLNPENYQVYWGIGVLRGRQVELTNDLKLVEKYLQQSREFISMAFKYNVPADQLSNLNMDLANSYNGLGAFYKQELKPELAKTSLESARKILLDVTQKESENGRALYLLAVTAFYQGNISEAKQLAEQSQNKHYKVPDDFLKELASTVR